MGDVKVLPISNTPVLEYLKKYNTLHKTSEVLAEIYLLEHVPEQLREQIQETQRRINRQ